MRQARIERQAAKVDRLARELRFELLLLRRMRARLAERAPTRDRPPAFGSLAEVYAAAVARSRSAEGGQTTAVEFGSPSVA